MVIGEMVNGQAAWPSVSTPLANSKFYRAGPTKNVFPLPSTVALKLKQSHHEIPAARYIYAYCPTIIAIIAAAARIAHLECDGPTEQIRKLICWAIGGRSNPV